MDLYEPVPSSEPNAKLIAELKAEMARLHDKIVVDQDQLVRTREMFAKLKAALDGLIGSANPNDATGPKTKEKAQDEKPAARSSFANKSLRRKLELTMAEGHVFSVVELAEILSSLGPTVKRSAVNTVLHRYATGKNAVFKKVGKGRYRLRTEDADRTSESEETEIDVPRTRKPFRSARPGTLLERAMKVLHQGGKPMHISELSELLNTNRTSLVSTLERAVRTGTLTRPAPATYSTHRIDGKARANGAAGRGGLAV